MYYNKTRKNKTSGGAYKIPLRDTNLVEPYTTRYINAHGEISPEIFYVIPEKTYILMPNVCGVSTSTRQTFSEPLYLNREETDTSFRMRFTTGSGYTVFQPGDIIPLQTLRFDPTLKSTIPDKLFFGFVGVFSEGILKESPILKNLIKHKISDNVFEYHWKDLGSFIFDLLEHIRNFLNIQEKDTKGKPITPIYTVYKLILDTICGFPVTIYDALNTSTLKIFNDNIYRIDYMKSKVTYIGENYTKKIPYAILLSSLRHLLPLIPENSINKSIGNLILDAYREKRFVSRKGIHEVIEETRDPTKNTFFILNACRSLLEERTTTWNIDSTLSNTMNKSINLTKYSAKLISKIDTYTQQNITNPYATINMNLINELRGKRGFKKIIQPILTYHELEEIFRQTISISTFEDREFTSMLDLMKDIVKELEVYTPIQRVKATEDMEAAAVASRDKSLEILADERKKELEILQKRRKLILDKIRNTKTIRRGTPEERKRTLEDLTKELQDIEERISKT